MQPLPKIPGYELVQYLGGGPLYPVYLDLKSRLGVRASRSVLFGVGLSRGTGYA